jgi:hypothetical protein
MPLKRRNTMKRPAKESKVFQINFEARKRGGILTCPDDPLYDTEIVLCGKTQKECDAIAVKIRNSEAKPMTDEELVAAGAVDVTEESAGVFILVPK